MTRCTSSLVVFFLFLFPLFAFAQEGGFVEIVGLPWIEPNAVSINEYINGLLRISIIAAALITVVKLILAGAQYILSDVVTDKGAAKKNIRGALVGLLIILLAVLILRTINPTLVQLSALEPLNITFQPSQPTACELDPNSEACCISHGGNYVQTSAGGRCDEDILPIPGTGNQDQDRANCERLGGTARWDEQSNTCVTTSILQMELTEVARRRIERAQQDGIAGEELRDYRDSQCQQLGGSNRWKYNPSADNCINTFGY